MATRQFADKQTRSQSTHRLENLRALSNLQSACLAEKITVYNRSKCDFY